MLKSSAYVTNFCVSHFNCFAALLGNLRNIQLHSWSFLLRHLFAYTAHTSVTSITTFPFIITTSNIATWITLSFCSKILFLLHDERNYGTVEIKCAKNSLVCHFILKDQFLIRAFVLTVLEHLQQIFTQLMQ